MVKIVQKDNHSHISIRTTSPASENYCASMSSDEDINSFEAAYADGRSSSSDTYMSVDNVQEYRWLDHEDGDFYRDKRARRGLAMIYCHWGFSLKDRGFPRFLRTLNPNFKFRYDAVKADCLRIYKERKDRVRQILGHLDGQVSLSLEMGYSYVYLKVHFLDENWKLKVWVLSFDIDGCAEEVITSSLSGFGIWNKVSTITFKCDPFLNQCLNDIKKFVQEKKQLQLNGKIFHVYCCADLFREMVEDAFKEITKIIDKCSELTMRKSSFSWRSIYKFLRLGVELECQGEWNKDIYEGYEKLTTDEWKKVEDICEIVGYVYNVAHVLFETKVPTSNIYFHRFQSLREKLSQEAISSNSFRCSVAQKMMVKFDEYWKDMFMVLAIAAVVDPRLKMKYIEFSSSKYESADGSYQVSTVMEALRNLCDGYVTCTTETDVSFSDSCNDSDEEFLIGRGKKKPKQCAYEDMDWMHEYNEFAQSTSQPKKSDLDLYLEEPIVPWDEDFNVLSWWETNSSRYPTVSKLARDFLAIRISVLRSHDAFLTVEREISSDKLGCKLKNALMCTRSWFQDQPNVDV